MNNIKFKNICKAYGDTLVVKDLNFEVQQGERLILLGPSGCGKTTTLRMIAGLESITSGELEVGGKVVNEMPPGERNIAMLLLLMPKRYTLQARNWYKRFISVTQAILVVLLIPKLENY